ncbi:MAG: c-type cytochrome [Actinomycetota bacterium]|nr:c-type cytochrome [Actinomycetota bacterium]
MIALLIALATTAFAWVILTVLVIGFVVYALFNSRSARREFGSEIELAPNRRPYYDDEELEGRRLELVQFLGVLLLVVIVIGLPLYWVFEPNRQAGATEGAENRFEGWGADLFAPTAEGGFNCAGCHGGMNATGGSAPFTITDPETGEVRAITWVAPALNNVFYRFDRDEVSYIITYGRPGSPMSAWGLAGGGPMNDQQIESLVEYLESIQIPRENCSPEEAADPMCPTGNLPAEMQEAIDGEARTAVENGEFATYGEALFNLGMAGGSYSCARCHTTGWSWGDPGEPGQGAFGWNLTGAAVNTHFPITEDMIDFVSDGSVNGAGFGRQGQGSGKMPAFGAMLTDEQITAIVEYVRGL